MNAPLPEDETARLENLRQYNIVDTPAEETFDDLTSLAAQICETPIALISLVERERQWFKSRVGLGATEAPRSISFSAYTVYSKEILTVRDALQDERFKDNPLVTSDPHIRFYAGAPLITPEGHALGTLCVIDYVARDLSQEQQKALQALARQVVSLLELRRKQFQFLQSNDCLEREITERKLAAEKLSRLAAIVDSTDDAIISKTLEGVIVSWNPAAEKIYGYKAEEAIGQSIHILFPLGQPDEISQILDRIKRGERIDHFETVRARKDGRLLHVSLTISPIRNGSGEIIGASAIARDITERRRVEEALRDSEERFKTFMNNSPAIAFMKDEQGRYVYANKTFQERFESPLYSIKGGSDFNWLPEEIAHRVRESDSVVINSGKRVETVEVIPNPDGERHHWLIFKFPFFGASGQRYVGGVGIDITQQKKMEADLGKTRDEALQLARVKSEFLANMSHEIRTPMNGIVGMTDLLLKTTLSYKQQEFASTIRSSAESLLTVINDILDFSKIEAGKLLLETVDFSARDVVEEVVQLFAQRARVKGLEMFSLIYSDVPSLLRGDPGRLRQVLSNLLSNAVKFTERGKIVVRLTKEDETSDDVVLRFAVTDSGVGIPEEHQRLLFNPFIQADSSTTRKYGGTGLGLAISKQLVELMGGEIGFESAPGKGSTFWFRVRFLKPLITSAALPTGDIQPYRLRVLIVDHSETNQGVIRHQLESWMISSSSAKSGAEGLTLLRRAVDAGEPFDLLIFEAELPDMDGLALARAIKLEPAIASTELIMMTPVDYDEDHETLRQVSLAAILTKPVKQSQLYDSLAIISNSRSTGNRTKVLSNSSRERDQQQPSLGSDDQFKHVRILVADDNAVNQKVALYQLEELGYRADAVANGIEVLEALEKEPYDMILMDCQMPVMDGYQATAEIRSREGSEKHTPIIAMTAHALEGDREKCLAAGMDDYISKPVNPDTLRKVLMKWDKEVRINPSITAIEIQSQDTLEDVIEPAVLSSFSSHKENGRHDRMLELVDLFLRETLPVITTIREALRNGDVRSIPRAAHSLKGNSSTIGLRRLAELSEELEEKGRDGSPDLESTFIQLEREFQRVQQVLAFEQRRRGEVV